MLLYGVRLSGYDFDKDPEQVEDVMVTLPYGWYVVLLLEGVTERELNRLAELQAAADEFFLEGVYRHANGIVQAQISDEKITEYVKRGALWDSAVALELGRSLYQRLLTQL